ncbi:MAG: DUF885 domain-containing protein, partial [Planctomycetaceae bacterium]|nr:DUF885 domain-containing protein [Planctomycetaceae bacterium]
MLPTMCLMVALLGADAPASTPADKAFQSAADEFLSGYFAFRPHTALELGMHEYDGKLADYSQDAIARELTRLKTFEERFAKWPVDELTPAARADRDVLLAGLRKAKFESDGAESFQKNPITYLLAVQIDNYLLREYSPLADRVRSIIAVEKQLPRLLASARANLQPVLGKPIVETAIKVANGGANFLKDDLPKAIADLKDDALRAELKLANDVAIVELRGYAKWLETERLPKSDHRFGIGKEDYARMLRELELVTQSPEVILELGMKELRREQAVFAETAKQINPTKPAIEVFTAIQEDHPTAEGLIPDTARNLEAIRQFVVDKKIASMPSDVRCKVDYTPPFRRATSFASMDAPGPFEKKASEAYYYVTPTEKEWPDAQKEEWLSAFNYYTTDVVSIHEVYPGHYTQFLHLNASSATRASKIFNSYAFVEGWAHYTEKVVIDAGYGSSKSETPTEEERKRAAKYRMA